MNNINELSGVKNNKLYYQENQRIIKELISDGIDINNHNIYGENALFYSKSIKAKILINYGINIHQIDIDGNTALLFHMIKNEHIMKNKKLRGKQVFPLERIPEVMAIPIRRNLNKQDQIEFLNILINSGIDLNHNNNLNENALFYADADITKLLLNKGINIHQINNIGENALFYADIDMCKILIKNGINTEQLNIYNKKFIDYLTDEEKEELSNIYKFENKDTHKKSYNRKLYSSISETEKYLKKNK